MPLTQDPTFQGPRNLSQFIGSIARTDTTAKPLFTLPAGCIPLKISYSATAPSNAGTTATISVGISGGSATAFLAATDVKTAGTGGGSQNPTASASTQYGVPLAAASVVIGTYAETGGASSSGGPWVVVMDVALV